jgi:hypothetical protein
VLGFERFTVTVTPLAGASRLRGPAAAAALAPLKRSKLGAVTPHTHSRRRHK